MSKPTCPLPLAFDTFSRLFNTDRNHIYTLSPNTCGSPSGIYFQDGKYGFNACFFMLRFTTQIVLFTICNVYARIVLQ